LPKVTEIHCQPRQYRRFKIKSLHLPSEKEERKKEAKKEKYTGMGYRPYSFDKVLGGIRNQAIIL